MYELNARHTLTSCPHACRESGHMDVESIPFSPSKLISDVVVPLRLQAKEKGLDLTSNCDLQPDTVLLGDAWRMRQILTNLVGNSLKFTDEGQVNLTVRTVEHGEPGIIMVQFVVYDSGIGIEEDVMKALFTPFHQADSTTARLHGGTGLGLTICRQVWRSIHLNAYETPANHVH